MKRLYKTKWSETRDETLVRLETVSRPRRRDWDHIPAGRNVREWALKVVKRPAATFEVCLESEIHERNPARNPLPILFNDPNFTVTARVRSILVFCYWVLGNIRRYWIVLLLGDHIYFCCDIQCHTDQTAVRTTLSTIIVIIIQF